MTCLCRSYIFCSASVWVKMWHLDLSLLIPHRVEHILLFFLEIHCTQNLTVVMKQVLQQPSMHIGDTPALIFWSFTSSPWLYYIKTMEYFHSSITWFTQSFPGSSYSVPKYSTVFHLEYLLANSCCLLASFWKVSDLPVQARLNPLNYWQKQFWKKKKKTFLPMWHNYTFLYKSTWIVSD